MAKVPKDLEEFCSMGTPIDADDDLYQLWERSWDGGDTGINSRPIVRDTSDPITLDELPDNCLVMEGEEFAHFEISQVYVRDSYIKLAHLIIESHGGADASSTATKEFKSHERADASSTGTKEFTNPFTGFKEKRRRAITVLGTPGSGKSLFLYFLLRCRLQAKLPTIFQMNSKAFYLFTEYDVHYFLEAPLDIIPAGKLFTIAPDMWCLVDSSSTNATPSEFLQSSRLSIIQSAFPCQSRIRWTQESNLGPMRLYMPPFSLEEAIIARSLQNISPSERQLEEWFGKFIPSARLAYQNAAHASEYEKKLERSLAGIVNAEAVVTLSERASSFADDDLSHQIFALLPSEDYDDYTFEVPTRYLSKKLVECALRSNGNVNNISPY